MTVTCQAPQSMGFSRQESWSGLPCPPPGDLPDSKISSVHFSHSVMSDSLRPHESQHARLPCPSPAPGVYSNSCPSKTYNPSLNHEKNFRQTQIEGHPIKYLTITPPNCQDHQNEDWEALSVSQETKETTLNVLCPGQILEQKKEH